MYQLDETMKITLLSVGNKMPSWIKTGYEEYLKRLSNDHTITLIEGESLSTLTFSKKLEHIQNTSQKDLTFLIGEADGLPIECKEASDSLWSLSPLTFPHMLVRVILIEQLYRAFSVLKNHPYHREGGL
jgi:23S rRNA (pseudouridine1915-N3)-methyltransferase